MTSPMLMWSGISEATTRRFIHISERSDIDGSFIISEILGQILKKADSGVSLICFQQSYQHYLNAGRGLKYNLEKFNGKTLHVIEPYGDIAEDFTKNYWTNTTKSDLIENLFESIQNNIENNLKDLDSVTVIIDNLAFLINLGVSQKSILKFCKKLEHISMLYSEKNKIVSIITKLSNSDVYEILNNNINAISDIQLCVIKLESGLSKDYEGCLKKVEENSENIGKEEKYILYKSSNNHISISKPLSGIL